MDYIINDFYTQNIYNKNEVLNTNLKERKLQEAKIKLTALEEKLQAWYWKTKKNYKPYHKLSRINM